MKQLTPRHNRTSYVVHFFMSLITLGVWIPVWMLFTLINNLDAKYFRGA